MRIGILSANEAEAISENSRLRDEIENAGHEPVDLNYHYTSVSVQQEGRALQEYPGKGRVRAEEIAAVIPRINECEPRDVKLGLSALRVLMSRGVYSTATPESILLAKSKIDTKIALDGSGIAVPFGVAPTGINFSHHKEQIDNFEPDATKYLIVKTDSGTHGHGVVLTQAGHAALSVAQFCAVNKIPYIIEEFIEPTEPGTHQDKRLIVIGGIVVASMLRKSKDFRANMSLEGGEGYSYDPTPREAEMALNAAEVIGLGVAGVDLIDSTRGPLVTEVNASPGLGIEKITDVNVARAIVELAIRGAQTRELA